MNSQPARQTSGGFVCTRLIAKELQNRLKQKCDSKRRAYKNKSIRD